MNILVVFRGLGLPVVSLELLSYAALMSGFWSGRGSPSPHYQPHTRSLWHSQQEGKVSDLLQEKVSPGRDPAVENLLESTKDWSDYGDHGEWKKREEKRWH